MSDDEKFLSMMRALSDPNRLSILRILKGKRLCSCQILKDMDISQPTLSHHMSILLDAGLVKTIPTGRWYDSRSTRRPGPSLSRTSGRSSEIQKPGSRKEVAGCRHMHVLRLKGNLGRTRFIFLSEDRRSDVLRGYRRKAERDYDDMVNLQNALDNSKKPRKKYRVSNVFVDTYLQYRFPLRFDSRESAVEHAVRTMTCGREGIFVLLTNRPLTA